MLITLPNQKKLNINYIIQCKTGDYVLNCNTPKEDDVIYVECENFFDITFHSKRHVEVKETKLGIKNGYFLDKASGVACRTEDEENLIVEAKKKGSRVTTDSFGNITGLYKKPETRGGKREHAGAKLKHGEPTAVIRLPISMIERIKNGSFDNVTNSNDAELEKYKAANAKLVEERDKYYQHVIELENQNRDLKRLPVQLRTEIRRLNNLKNNCQAIKADGERCDRHAKGKVNFHGVLINVCLQHQNQLSKC